MRHAIGQWEKTSPLPILLAFWAEKRRMIERQNALRFKPSPRVSSQHLPFHARRRPGLGAGWHLHHDARATARSADSELLHRQARLDGNQWLGNPVSTHKGHPEMAAKNRRALDRQHPRSRVFRLHQRHHGMLRRSHGLWARTGRVTFCGGKRFLLLVGAGQCLLVALSGALEVRQAKPARS